MEKEELLKGMLRAFDNGEGSFRRWLSAINKLYKKRKADGEVTDDNMIGLCEFWLSAVSILQEDLFDALHYLYGDDIPVMLKDIDSFLPRYSELSFQREIAELDEIELRETESLAKAIWDKNLRAELSFSVFSWEQDDVINGGITIPRKREATSLVELKRTCAAVISNRGSMTIRFFLPKGQYEIAVVTVFNSEGIWESVSPKEVEEGFEDGLYDNEHPIVLRNPIKPGQNVLKFSLADHLN